MSKKYSNLKSMLAITGASLRSIKRNPMSILFSLLFPLIFIIVFGFISGSGFKISVGINGQSSMNNPVTEVLKNTGTIRMVEGLSDEEMINKLNRGKLDIVLNITKNQDGKLPAYIIEYKSNKAQPERSALFRLILENIVNRANLSLSGLSTQAAEIKEQVVEGRVYKTIDFILPGQLGFAILGAGVFGTAFIFLSLRETLVIKRFFATPVNRRYILLGEGLARLIFSLSTAVVIILAGYYFFGFTLVNGVSTFLTMLAISALGLIVFLGFGFLVSNLAGSLNTLPPLANLITLPQFLLAGTFFSIEVFPSWLQPVSRALPLTYLNEALRKAAFEGAGIFNLGYELGILAAWGAVIYILAIKFFRWE